MHESLASTLPDQSTFTCLVVHKNLGTEARPPATLRLEPSGVFSMPTRARDLFTAPPPCSIPGTPWPEEVKDRCSPQNFSSRCKSPTTLSPTAPNREKPRGKRSCTEGHQKPVRKLPLAGCFPSKEPKVRHLQPDLGKTAVRNGAPAPNRMPYLLAIMAKHLHGMCMQMHPRKAVARLVPGVHRAPPLQICMPNPTLATRHIG